MLSTRTSSPLAVAQTHFLAPRAPAPHVGSRPEREGPKLRSLNSKPGARRGKSAICTAFWATRINLTFPYARRAVSSERCCQSVDHRRDRPRPSSGTSRLSGRPTRLSDESSTEMARMDRLTDVRSPSSCPTHLSQRRSEYFGARPNLHFPARSLRPIPSQMVCTRPLNQGSHARASCRATLHSS